MSFPSFEMSFDAYELHFIKTLMKAETRELLASNTHTHSIFAAQDIQAKYSGCAHRKAHTYAENFEL